MSEWDREKDKQKIRNPKMRDIQRDTQSKRKSEKVEENC